MTDTKTKLESDDPAQIGTLTREDLLGDMFYAGSMGYFAQYIALSHIAALSQRNTHNLSMGYGSFGYEPNVNYLFGIPTSIEAGGVAMDVRLGRFIGTHNNDPEAKKQLNQQVGILSSALEHAVPEQMFTTDPLNPADGVSTVKALSKASQAGQRIYHLTQENQATALPSIHHSPETMTEITKALAVGKEVITHTDAISVPGWSGAGYIILDPQTGDAGYKISGGGNGGWVNKHSEALGVGALFVSLSAGIFGAATAAILLQIALLVSLIIVMVKIAYAAQDLTGSCKGLLWIYGGLSTAFGLLGLSKSVPVTAIASSFWALIVGGSNGPAVDACKKL